MSEPFEEYISVFILERQYIIYHKYSSEILPLYITDTDFVSIIGAGIYKLSSPDDVEMARMIVEMAGGFITMHPPYDNPLYTAFIPSSILQQIDGMPIDEAVDYIFINGKDIIGHYATVLNKSENYEGADKQPAFSVFRRENDEWVHVNDF